MTFSARWKESFCTVRRKTQSARLYDSLCQRSWTSVTEETTLSSCWKGFLWQMKWLSLPSNFSSSPNRKVTYRISHLKYWHDSTVYCMYMGIIFTVRFCVNIVWSIVILATIWRKIFAHRIKDIYKHRFSPRLATLFRTVCLILLSASKIWKFKHLREFATVSAKNWAGFL